MSTNNNIEIPPTLDKEKLEDIYQRSDFDWTNQEKFYKFMEWYLKNIFEVYDKVLEEGFSQTLNSQIERSS